MKNKKYIAYTFIFVGILIIAMSFSLNFDYKRLKSSISEANSDGLQLSIVCTNNTLSVNETTTCTLSIVGQTDISGFEGAISTNDKIEITNVVKNTTDFSTMGDSPTQIVLYGNKQLHGTTTLATITVKALSNGTGKITVEKDSSDKLIATLSADTSSSALNGTTENITVSSGGGDEDPKSNNAYLRDLRVGLGATYASLTPTFNKTTYNYTVNYSDDDAIQNQIIAEIEWDKDDNSSTVQGSTSVNLTNETSKTVSISVTAEDGVTNHTYKINFVKTDAKSSNNKLSSLTVCHNNVCDIALSPVFNQNIEDYTAIVPNEIDSVNISATKADNSATVTGDGDQTLPVGSTLFNIEVTAENGAKKYYKLTIERLDVPDADKSSVNTLTSLKLGNNIKLSPTFSENVTDYTASSSKVLSEVNIEVTPKDTKSTVLGDGIRTLVKGTNILIVRVTAENGVPKLYTITFENGSEEKTCTMTLSSKVYQIDNDKLVIGGVDKDHSNDTILSNLKVDCGALSIDNDKVTVTYNGQSKIYSVERAFIAKTGTKIIKYAIIIGSLCIMIGALMLVLIHMKKKNNE